MSAVPGLSLRDTVAQIIAKSDEAAGLDSDAYDLIAPIYHLAADALLADPRLVVALRTNTREGWAWRGADERGWLVYWSPDCTKDATDRVLVVPIDPPEANDA